MVDKSIKNLKDEVIEEVTKIKDKLVRLSSYLYQHPEVGGEEFLAFKVFTDELEKNGFEVKKGLVGMPTSFIATFNCKNIGPTIAIIAEYDALINIGHGSGHNLTGTAGVGAAIAISKLCNFISGKIICIGAPGETKFNSKIFMIKNGIFNNIDVAMILQSGNKNITNPILLADEALQFSYKGKASHAAAAPHEGINALDAVIMLFNSINALRQQLKEDVRIHGIITKGGNAVNIITDLAIARFSIRAKTRKYLTYVTEKVKNCAKGASIQTGALLEISYFEDSLNDLNNNKVLEEEYMLNLISLGESISDEPEILGSNDIGNVSYIIPTIAPVIKIAKEGVELHTSLMTEASHSKLGQHGLEVGCKALAMTGIRLLYDKIFYKTVKDSFFDNVKIL